MRYTLLVTGPAYGTQHASSALLFARALLAQGHQLESVFFYREGVLNANQLSARPAMKWTWCAPGSSCATTVARR